MRKHLSKRIKRIDVESKRREWRTVIYTPSRIDHILTGPGEYSFQELIYFYFGVSV